VGEETSFEGVQDHYESLGVVVKLVLEVKDVLKVVRQVIDHLEPL
jgi:hypothetical protein